MGATVARLMVDVPNLAAGTLPDDEYDTRFVRHPWLTYLHIMPGVLYMVGATAGQRCPLRRFGRTFDEALPTAIFTRCDICTNSFTGDV